MADEQHLTPSEAMRANTRWHGHIKSILLNDTEPNSGQDATESDREQSAYLSYVMTALTFIVVEHFAGERPGLEQISYLVKTLREQESDAGRPFDRAKAHIVIQAALNEDEQSPTLPTETEAIEAGHHVLWALAASTPGIAADVGRIMGDIDRAHQIGTSNTQAG